MNTIANITEKNGQLAVAGELNFETVPALWKQSLILLRKCTVIDIDFSNVTAVNSAALALLVEWIKQGKRENKKVMFRGIPLQLKSIAKALLNNSLYAFSA